MATLKVPSVQHLARNWRDGPERISRALVRLALNPPIFNYLPLFGAVRDLLVLGVPYEQVRLGIERIKRADVRKNFLEVLPLLRDHFEGLTPDFFQTVERRYYPVGRNLMVPFDPPMIYGVGGQLYFPWLSFWRQNPLKNEALSLFVTLVDEILLQDPDLESAKFQILDFSCPSSGAGRVLREIDAALIPRLSPTRKVEMLEVFAEGYAAAEMELAGRAGKAKKDDRPTAHPDQLSLLE